MNEINMHIYKQQVHKMKTIKNSFFNVTGKKYINAAYLDYEENTLH